MYLFDSVAIYAQTERQLEQQVHVDAQTRHYPRVGLEAGASWNMYSANFRGLPNVPSCCPQYTSGSGTGAVFGAIGEFPLDKILGDQWNAILRLNYVSHSGTLQATELQTISQNGNAVTLPLEHTISAQISSLGVEPAIGFFPFSAQSIFSTLRFSLGMRLGWLMSNTFSQKEVYGLEIGAFKDGNRVRLDTVGTIENVQQFQSSVVLGASYSLPLNARGSLVVVPSLQYALSLGTVVENLDWKLNGLRATLGIEYVFLPPPPPKPVFRDTLYQRDTIQTRIVGLQAEEILKIDEKTVFAERETRESIQRTVTIQQKYERKIPQPKPIQRLNVALSARGITPQKEVIPKAKLLVEEYLSTQMTPLLPFVFFDENSSEIPSRYSRISPEATASFSINAVNSSEILPTYYHVLNIIGSRLRENSDANVVITGCASENISERNAMSLSKSRAEAVREYLVNIWKIEPKRLKIEYRVLPQKPSNTQTTEGSEENRRVEITSSLPEILAPVISSDTLVVASLSSIDFIPQVEAEAGVRAWKLTAAFGQKNLVELSGKNETPSVKNIEISTAKEQFRSASTILGMLEIEDNDDQKQVAQVEIPVEQKTLFRKRAEGSGNVTRDNYRLILFDFDEYSINKLNRKVIETVIKPRIREGSNIEISGYTDKTGSAERNAMLSERRARSTSEVLGYKGDIRIQGIGAEQQLHSNLTPEGRFYCRTVTIMVETPAENR